MCGAMGDSEHIAFSSDCDCKQCRDRGRGVYSKKFSKEEKKEEPTIDELEKKIKQLKKEKINFFKKKIKDLEKELEELER